MAQLDNKLTESIKKWLDTAPNERDIIAGATMLLQLNRNRAMFNTITRKPEREADRLEYELRKHLRIRLDNMTVADVANMDKKVIPSAKEVLETLPVVSTDDEIPEARSARGRRQDHDSLPAHIQALYDNNINLYKKIKMLFEELKTMENALPCDRYERLKLLDEADKTYRANLEAYDNYVKPADNSADNDAEPTTAEQSSANVSPADVVKQIGSARKTISKYRTKLAKLVEANDPKADAIRNKLQDCVRTIQTAGAGLAPATQSELEALGIKF
ncbi:MAG: hypothetical protein J6B30_02310 [Muribaculaceae bacterium]|nr:hypothetical protein [Muribaculaceae bacterium]